jgi:hypothetical protein
VPRVRNWTLGTVLLAPGHPVTAGAPSAISAIHEMKQGGDRRARVQELVNRDREDAGKWSED